MPAAVAIPHAADREVLRQVRSIQEIQAHCAKVGFWRDSPRQANVWLLDRSQFSKRSQDSLLRQPVSRQECSLGPGEPAIRRVELAWSPNHRRPGSDFVGRVSGLRAAYKFELRFVRTAINTCTFCHHARTIKLPRCLQTAYTKPKRAAASTL